MIKAEVIESFTLDDFKKLKNIVRYNSNLKEEGHLYARDIFECDKEMADYLLGGNRLNRAFIKVIEVIPEKPTIKLDDDDIKVIAKEVNKVTKKKKTSKK